MALLFFFLFFLLSVKCIIFLFYMRVEKAGSEQSGEIESDGGGNIGPSGFSLCFLSSALSSHVSFSSPFILTLLGISAKKIGEVARERNDQSFVIENVC